MKSRIQHHVTKEQLEKLYYDENLSMREVARKLSMPDSLVMYHFEKYKIKTRTKSEAIKLGIKEGRVHRFNGEANPNWKGGKPIITSGGYRAVFCPNHPKGQVARTYVLEHILVWEKENGRPLPEGWVVHHINGRKSDNRPENLYGMPRKLHHDRLLLNTLRERIRKLEDEITQIKSQREFCNAD